MKTYYALFGFAFLILMPGIASAECYCACINNKKTKVCENSWDSNYVYCGGTYCSASLQLDLGKDDADTVLAMSFPTGKVDLILNEN